MENKINEEIKRIKSLFSEERLYGNLVKEQVTNPDSNGDFKIDAAELTASGNIITPEEAKLFVQSYQVANPTKNTEVGHCINQKVIKTISTDYPSLTDGTLNYGITSQGGLCYLYANNRDTVSSTYAAQITKLEFWQNDWVTFYATFGTPIDLSSKDGYRKTFNPEWDATAVGGIEARVKLNQTASRDEKIKYIQFKAPIDLSTMEYGQVTFMNFYDESGDVKNIQTLIDKFEERTAVGGTVFGGYRAGDGSGSSWVFSVAKSFDGFISSPNGLDIDPISGPIQDLVDNLER